MACFSDKKINQTILYVSKAQLTSPITAEMTMAARPHCKKAQNEGESFNMLKV